MKAFVVVCLVAALVGFGIFAAERRSDRASNTLRRELLDIGPVTSPRPLHVGAPLEGSTAQHLAGLFDPKEPPNIDALLAATHAREGGLPPGLALATAGPDSWAAVPAVAAALTARLAQSDATHQTCLDALALGRELARGGGTLGIAAALTMTEASFRPCGPLLTEHLSEPQRTEVITSLTRIFDGAPTLARAFREADLDVQVRLFGRWMRPEDLSELPATTQKAAHEARELPTAFFERQALLGQWTKLSKTTHAAMDALEQPATERTRLLGQLEAKVETPSLSFTPGWRTAIAQHERRLTLLRMLQLAARLTLAHATSHHWPALSDVEASELTLTPVSDTQATLTLKESPDATLTLVGVTQ